ncbi:MAG TPA: helix-turn-helix domain-containing protein [Pseudonocardia sp.]
MAARTRADILRAARTVFGRHGYAGGRTVAIAATAGVTERTVYRHFATKAELFSAAVVEPFHDFVGAFVREWNVREHGVLTAWQETRRFYAGLFDLLEAHRGLVVALAAARSFDDPSGRIFPGLGSQLADLLTTAEPTMQAEATARGLRGQPAISVRFMFGLAISTCVHGDWLFDSARYPERDTLLDELTAFTLRGLDAGEADLIPGAQVRRSRS